jgi:hypothetical protein
MFDVHTRLLDSTPGQNKQGQVMGDDFQVMYNTKASGSVLQEISVPLKS